MTSRDSARMVSLVRLLKSRMLGNHLSGSVRDEAATGSGFDLGAPRLLVHGVSRGGEGIRRMRSPGRGGRGYSQIYRSS